VWQGGGGGEEEGDLAPPSQLLSFNALDKGIKAMTIDTCSKPPICYIKYKSYDKKFKMFIKIPKKSEF